MKKLLFALTALAMIAVSCKDIQETDFMKITQLTLTASTEQPVGTRTMVAGAGEVFWEKGDEIKVFAGTASGKFVSDVESGIASTAIFTGSLGGAWTEGSPLWAVYPFSDEAILDGETLTAELPAVQTARGMSFARNMNLSVARTTTASLQFYNVGGGVCFTLTESGIRKVVFEGLNGEILSGKVKIAFQEDRPVVQEVVEGSTTVTLAAPEGKTLEGDGVWYYIVALPGTLEKGFKLSFYKGDAVAQKTFAKTVTVKRSIYGEVRNADEGVSYIPDTDENIAFKDAKVKSIVVRYFDTGKDGELSYKEAAAVRSFFVDEALTRADGDQVSVFAGTDIETFDEIVYFTGLTKIEDGAFAGCTQLTSITIPANITEIGANAFKGCTGLQSITILSETPPTIGEGAFADTNDCPIIVPAGTTDTYVTAWGEYAPRIEGGQPDNEIWYTTTDGQVVTPRTQAAVFGATLVSNEYADGKGVITFDGAVTQIGDNAFRDCRNLASIQLPMSVTRLGQWAFMLCNNLVDIQIPASVTLIDECAIQGCQSLVNIQIPESVSQIGNNAFNACTSLESIAIPASVIQIGTEAFGQVWSCTSIVVDPDNPVYDSRNDCNAIIETASNTLIAGCKTTVIPASVEIIGRNSFFGCRGLVNLTIPSSVTQIGNYAFSQCMDLVSVTIPSSVTQIGYYAFRRCNVLTSMTLLGEMPPQLEIGAFQSSDKCIFYVPAGSVEAYKTAQNWSDYADRIQAIGSEPQPNNEIWYTSTDGQVIHPSAADVFGADIKSNDYKDGKGVITFDGPVSSVGSRAFFRNDNLTEISLPEGVKYLGEMAFFRNRNLTSVTLPNSLDSIASRAFASCIKLSGIKIPSGVRSIGMSAFMNCPEITAITIPDGITRLEASVFAGTGITGIVIPEGVVSIGNNAFQDCSRLVRISLPESLVTIDGLAFQRCTALPSLKIPKSVKSIGSLAFLNCLGLKELSVDPGNSVFDSRDLCNAIIETASNTLRFGCSSTIIPGTVTIIGENAFMGSGLGRIDIPASVKTIGNQAFSECASLTSLTIPSGVLTIGRSVISNCPNLGSVVVADGNPRYDSRDQCNAIIETASNTLIAGCRISTIPSGISELGASAFTSCTGLTRIDIPAGVKIIGDAAFSNCSSLEEVSMPDGVVSIGHSAFSSCTALTGITLPASLTSLDQFSFYLCDALASVTALSVTPPTGSSSMFYGSNCPIYVPAASVEAYKAAAYWSDYADRIQAIP